MEKEEFVRKFQEQIIAHKNVLVELEGDDSIFIDNYHFNGNDMIFFVKNEEMIALIELTHVKDIF